MLRTLLSLLCLLLLEADVATDARAQAREPFEVGVLRADGILTSVLRFDGAAWMWLENDAATDSAATSGPWHFRTGGGLPRVLGTGVDVRFEAGHGPERGILTDYGPRLVARDTVPYPKAGIAVRPRQPLVAMAPVEEGSMAYRATLDKMQIPFAGFEAAAVEGALASDVRTYEEEGVRYVAPGIPAEADVRAGAPMRFRALRRSDAPVDGRRLYFFQAEKAYPHPSCTGTARLTGWFADSEGGLSILQEHLSLGGCDAGGADVRPDDPFLPLGLLPGEPTYAIVEGVGAEGPYYAVLALTDSDVRVVTTSE